MDFYKKSNSNEYGITLISLVIVVVLLIILSSVALVSFDEWEVINTTENIIGVYKTDREEVANEVDEMATNLYDKGIINSEKINIIRKKIRESSLSELEVDYTPEEKIDNLNNPLQVVVQGNYNGRIANQVYTQESLGARGQNKIKWYILSADENGLNLISEPTKAEIAFCGSAGYDNCLYYLNELSNKLFTNKNTLGVTENRVHAFKLSDLEKATQLYNEDSYVWKSRFEDGATVKGDYYNIEVNPTNKYWPGLYAKYMSNGTMTIVDTDDSERTVNLIKNDSGISRQASGNPATLLTVVGNYYEYNIYGQPDSSRTNTLNHLCLTDDATVGFGRTSLAQNELLKSAGENYWLASRAVKGGSTSAGYGIRYISSGSLAYSELCSSGGDGSNSGFANRFRVVVSIPPDHVEITANGTVSLK